jgi:PAS domain S-box-containing protein
MWQSLVANSPDTIILVDREGTIQLVNRLPEGVDPRDVLGASFYKFILPRYHGLAREKLRRVVEEGVPEKYELEGTGPRGGSSWYATRMVPVGRQGEITGAMLVATDVTERRKSEEELRFQKALLESQSEAAIDGILVVSREGKIISYNRRFLAMWEIPPEVAATRSDDAALQSVFDKLADPQVFLARVRHLYDHPDEVSRDEIALRDGRTFDRYSGPVRGADGFLYGRVWFFRDVTGRKCAEEGLRRAVEDARRAYDDLKQAQVQLIHSEKLASIGMLVSGVAHEINNPLNVIYGNLRLMEEQWGGACGMARGAGARRMKKMIRDALSGAEHARRIIGDFRNFARDTRTAERVDLNEALEETLTLLGRQLPPTVRVVRQYGRIPTIPCFRGQLNQVFFNLLKNAAEAIEKEGTITLRTSRRKDRVVVEVADTGRGMPPDVKKKLFEPFFTTKPVGKGLGLGLSISAMIVHNHGGEITVRSRPGRGTAFQVRIPVVPKA